MAHYLDNPVVGLGPTLTAELRGHLTASYRDTTGPHPHKTVLVASLNRRPASPIPPGALDPILALYRAAALPPDAPPAAAHHRAGRHLASVPAGPAALPAAAIPPTRKGPRL